VLSWVPIADGWFLMLNSNCIMYAKEFIDKYVTILHICSVHISRSCAYKLRRQTGKNGWCGGGKEITW